MVTLETLGPVGDTVVAVFPHAGAGPGFFRELAQEWLPSVTPVLVRLPGRETTLREPAFRSMAEAVPAVVDALAPVIEARTTIFFGHSLGGLVAFEVAHELRRTGGKEPDRLVVSGAQPPARRRAERTHLAPDKALWDVVCGLGGVPAEVAREPSLARVLIPALRADYTIGGTYRYRHGTPLTCPVTALSGRDDPEVDPPTMRHWQDETTGTFDQRILPGGHFFIMSGAGAGHLADLVTARPTHRAENT